MPKLFRLLLAILIPLDVFAAATTPSTTREVKSEGHRFLIMIEASKEMNRLGDGVIETALHLVESGFNGQVRDGDAFAIWLYRDRVATHLFEPILWDSKKVAAHRTVVEHFIVQLKYDGEANLKVATTELLQVVDASESVTLLMLSPGETAIEGTPFDGFIQSSFESKSRAIRKEKKPVVTAFLGVKGDIVDCRVSAGGKEVQLPSIPESLRNAPKFQTPTPSTNAPAKKTPPARKGAALLPPAPSGLSMSAGALAPRPIEKSPEPQEPPPAPAAETNVVAASTGAPGAPDPASIASDRSDFLVSGTSPMEPGASASVVSDAGSSERSSVEASVPPARDPVSLAAGIALLFVATVLGIVMLALMRRRARPSVISEVIEARARTTSSNAPRVSSGAPAHRV